MAGKHADIRYEVLDRCFGNIGTHYFIEDLIRECSAALKEHYGSDSADISRRTIFNDIAYLEQKFAGRFELDDSAYIGKRRYYRYKDHKFSIYGLNKSELVKVKDTLALLLKFKGLPQFTWINEVVAAIKTKLKIDLEDGHPEVMSFESNEDYEGLIHITDLFNAIINKLALKISYKPFNSDVAKEITFHPYYLKQYNSRWFVFGDNPAATKYKYEVLALDRILKGGIAQLTIPYKEVIEDWQDYFSDFVGVSKGDGKPVLIKIFIVDKEQASYIKTKPLHQTQNQNFKSRDNGFETSIKVIPNYELYKLLLSFGERVQVISPESVRQEMKRRIDAMQNLYK